MAAPVLKLARATFRSPLQQKSIHAEPRTGFNAFPVRRAGLVPSRLEQPEKIAVQNPGQNLFPDIHSIHSPAIRRWTSVGMQRQFLKTFRQSRVNEEMGAPRRLDDMQPRRRWRMGCLR